MQVGSVQQVLDVSGWILQDKTPLIHKQRLITGDEDAQTGSIHSRYSTEVEHHNWAALQNYFAVEDINLFSPHDRTFACENGGLIMYDGINFQSHIYLYCIF